MNDVNDIITSEDMENMSLVSQMYFHMKSMSGVKHSYLCNKYILYNR